MVRALFVVLCLLCVEANAATGEVSLIPATKTVDVGELFSVDVMGTFDTDVMGGGLTLHLTPATGVIPQDVVFNPDWNFIHTWEWDSGTLTTEFVADTAVPSGTFKILTFELLAQAEGEYLLGLTQSAVFGDSSFTPIDVTFDPANVPAQVTAVPEPAAAWMLIVGLALAAGVLCVRRASVL